MKNPLTLTERAVIKLNHMALSLHHIEFRKRLDRLVTRLTGERVAESVRVRVVDNCDYCELETPCAEDCGNCR